MGEDGSPDDPVALERAREQLAKLRRLLAEGRQGASDAWVAAAEDAIVQASRAVVRAGGHPEDRAEPDERGDATHEDGLDGVERLTS